MMNKLLHYVMVYVAFGTSFIFAQECFQKADIVFLLDGSDSILKSEFNDQKQVVLQFAQQIALLSNDVRVGAQVYSSVQDATTGFDLTNAAYVTPGLINVLKQPSHGSRLDAGLTRLSQLLTLHGRPNEAQIAVIFSDGHNERSGDTKAVAESLKASGIYLTAVGVGRAIRIGELQALSSFPSDYRNIAPINLVIENIIGITSATGTIWCSNMPALTTQNIPIQLDPTIASQGNANDQASGIQNQASGFQQALQNQEQATSLQQAAQNQQQAFELQQALQNQQAAVLQQALQGQNEAAALQQAIHNQNQGSAMHHSMQNQNQGSSLINKMARSMQDQQMQSPQALAGNSKQASTLQQGFTGDQSQNLIDTTSTNIKNADEFRIHSQQVSDFSTNANQQFLMNNQVPLQQTTRTGRVQKSTSGSNLGRDVNAIGMGTNVNAKDSNRPNDKRMVVQPDNEAEVRVMLQLPSVVENEQPSTTESINRFYRQATTTQRTPETTTAAGKSIQELVQSLIRMQKKLQKTIDETPDAGNSIIMPSFHPSQRASLSSLLEASSAFSSFSKQDSLNQKKKVQTALEIAGKPPTLRPAEPPYNLPDVNSVVTSPNMNDITAKKQQTDTNQQQNANIIDAQNVLQEDLQGQMQGHLNQNIKETKIESMSTDMQHKQQSSAQDLKQSMQENVVDPKPVQLVNTQNPNVIQQNIPDDKTGVEPNVVGVNDVQQLDGFTSSSTSKDINQDTPLDSVIGTTRQQNLITDTSFTSGHQMGGHQWTDPNLSPTNQPTTPTTTTAQRPDVLPATMSPDVSIGQNIQQDTLHTGESTGTDVGLLMAGVLRSNIDQTGPPDNNNNQILTTGQPVIDAPITEVVSDIVDQTGTFVSGSNQIPPTEQSIIDKRTQLTDILTGQSVSNNNIKPSAEKPIIDAGTIMPGVVYDNVPPTEQPIIDKGTQWAEVITGQSINNNNQIFPTEQPILDAGTQVTGVVYDNVPPTEQPIIDEGTQLAGVITTQSINNNNQIFPTEQPIIDAGTQVTGVVYDNVPPTEQPIIDKGTQLAEVITGQSINNNNQIFPTEQPIIDAGTQVTGVVYDNVPPTEQPIIDKGTQLTGVITTQSIKNNNQIPPSEQPVISKEMTGGELFENVGPTGSYVTPIPPTEQPTTATTVGHVIAGSTDAHRNDQQRGERTMQTTDIGQQQTDKLDTSSLKTKESINELINVLTETSAIITEEIRKAEGQKQQTDTSPPVDQSQQVATAGQSAIDSTEFASNNQNTSPTPGVDVSGAQQFQSQLNTIESTPSRPDPVTNAEKQRQETGNMAELFKQSQSHLTPDQQSLIENFVRVNSQQQTEKQARYTLQVLTDAIAQAQKKKQANQGFNTDALNQLFVQNPMGISSQSAVHTLQIVADALSLIGKDGQVPAVQDIPQVPAIQDVPPVMEPSLSQTVGTQQVGTQTQDQNIPSFEASSNIESINQQDINAHQSNQQANLIDGTQQQTQQTSSSNTEKGSQGSAVDTNIQTTVAELGNDVTQDTATTSQPQDVTPTPSIDLLVNYENIPSTATNDKQGVNNQMVDQGSNQQYSAKASRVSERTKTDTRTSIQSNFESMSTSTDESNPQTNVINDQTQQSPSTSSKQSSLLQPKPAVTQPPPPLTQPPVLITQPLPPPVITTQPPVDYVWRQSLSQLRPDAGQKPYEVSAPVDPINPSVSFVHLPGSLSQSPVNKGQSNWQGQETPFHFSSATDSVFNQPGFQEQPGFERRSRFQGQTPPYNLGQNNQPRQNFQGVVVDTVPGVSGLSAQGFETLDKQTQNAHTTMQELRNREQMAHDAGFVSGGQNQPNVVGFAGEQQVNSLSNQGLVISGENQQNTPGFIGKQQLNRISNEGLVSSGQNQQQTVGFAGEHQVNGISNQANQGTGSTQTGLSKTIDEQQSTLELNNQNTLANFLVEPSTVNKNTNNVPQETIFPTRPTTNNDQQVPRPYDPDVTPPMEVDLVNNAAGVGKKINEKVQQISNNQQQQQINTKNTNLQNTQTEQNVQDINVDQKTTVGQQQNVQLNQNQPGLQQIPQWENQQQPPQQLHQEQQAMLQQETIQQQQQQLINSNTQQQLDFGLQQQEQQKQEQQQLQQQQQTMLQRQQQQQQQQQLIDTNKQQQVNFDQQTELDRLKQENIDLQQKLLQLQERQDTILIQQTRQRNQQVQQQANEQQPQQVNINKMNQLELESLKQEILELQVRLRRQKQKQEQLTPNIQHNKQNQNQLDTNQQLQLELQRLKLENLELQKKLQQQSITQQNQPTDLQQQQNHQETQKQLEQQTRQQLQQQSLQQQNEQELLNQKSQLENQKLEQQRNQEVLNQQSQLEIQQQQQQNIIANEKQVQQQPDQHQQDIQYDTVPQTQQPGEKSSQLHADNINKTLSKSSEQKSDEPKFSSKFLISPEELSRISQNRPSVDSRRSEMHGSNQNVESVFQIDQLVGGKAVQLPHRYEATSIFEQGNEAMGVSTQGDDVAGVSKQVNRAAGISGESGSIDGKSNEGFRTQTTNPVDNVLGLSLNQLIWGPNYQQAIENYQVLLQQRAAKREEAARQAKLKAEAERQAILNAKAERLEKIKQARLAQEYRQQEQVRESSQQPQSIANVIGPSFVTFDRTPGDSRNQLNGGISRPFSSKMLFDINSPGSVPVVVGGELVNTNNDQKGFGVNRIKTSTKSSTHSSLSFSSESWQSSTSTMEKQRGNTIKDLCLGSRFVNGVAYNAEPSNCHQLIQCFYYQGSIKVEKSSCPFKMHWDQDLLLCRPANPSSCSRDPCLRPGVKSYKGGTCRSYYSCENGKPVPKCCPYGLSYRDDVGGCAVDTSCTSFCEEIGDEYFRKPFPTCRLAPFHTTTEFYFEHVPGVGMMPRMCAGGSAFNAKLCTCETPSSQSELDAKLPGIIHNPCKPEFMLDFAEDFVDVSGNRLPLNHEHVLIDRGYAKFEGSGRITIWRFSGGTFGEQVAFTLRFRPIVNWFGAQRMDLLSNCDREGPSVGISVTASDQGGYVTFMADASDSGVSTFNIAYKGNGWNNVTYIYDGKHLTGEVNGISNSVPLMGVIDQRTSPITLGSCNYVNNYYGLMDDVRIYMCIPSWLL